MVATKAVDADIVAALRHKLVQPGTSLSHKYRVLFSLRNIPGMESGEAIIEGTSLVCSSTFKLAAEPIAARLQDSRTHQLCSGTR